MKSFGQAFSKACGDLGRRLQELVLATKRSGVAVCCPQTAKLPYRSKRHEHAQASLRVKFALAAQHRQFAVANTANIEVNVPPKGRGRGETTSGGSPDITEASIRALPYKTGDFIFRLAPLQAWGMRTTAV